MSFSAFSHFRRTELLSSFCTRPCIIPTMRIVAVRHQQVDHLHAHGGVIVR